MTSTDRWPAWGSPLRQAVVSPLWAVALVALVLCGCGASVDGNFQEVGLSPAGDSSGSSGSSGQIKTASSAGDTSGLGTAGAASDSARRATGAQRSAAGAATVPPGASQLLNASTPGDFAYKIGPLDVVEVAVFKVPELSRVVQVAETGTINLPLVGETRAAGMTAQEVERDLAKKLGAKYLQSPQVNVYVREFNSQRVVVEGAVKKPGVYPIRGKTTLLQVMAQAEGINTDVANNEVAIFRTIDGKRSAAKFDVSEIRAGRAEDVQVQAGDLVVVDSSALKTGFTNFVKALPIATFLALAL